MATVVSGVIATTGVLLGGGQAAADGNSSLASLWKLNERSGLRTFDSVTREWGQLRGGAAFVPGRVRNAVALDGVDDHVTGPVHVNTDSSFTVAAWVNLSRVPPLGDESAVRSIAVSINGDRTSKFRLGHVIDTDQAPRGKWLFEMPESDVDDAQITEGALSVEPALPNTWVHLVGVYDAPNRKVSLFVDGNRVDDGTINTPWQASGGIRIGTGRVNGADGQFFPGTVDDVRIYQAALDKDAVRQLYLSYPDTGA